MAPRDKMQRMAEWLREYLSDGPVPATDLFADAAVHGYPIRTLRKVDKQLGVEHYKSGNQWYWELPEPPQRYPTTVEWCRYCGQHYRREQPRLHLGERIHGEACPDHEREVRELTEAAERRKRDALEAHRKRIAAWEADMTARLNVQEERRAETDAERRDRRMRQLGLSNPVPESGAKVPMTRTLPDDDDWWTP